MGIAELISAVSAATAAVAATVGLRYARQSVRTGKEGAVLGRRSAEAAQATVRLAEETRRDAERDRERHRLEHIGELVERVFWLTGPRLGNEVNDQFRQQLNLLRQALVGLETELPRSNEVLQAANVSVVAGPASSAREEIRLHLQTLGSDLASRPETIA